MSFKEGFHLIGISVRTSNEAEQAMKDIPHLWNRFMTEQIANKILNKIDREIYCVYTEYEGDHTKPYTTLLGCKVSHLGDIPDGLRGISFDDANYKLYTVKGDLTKGAVAQKWHEIWNENLPRTYIADFEVYGEKAQDITNAEVQIFIGIDQN